MTRHWTATFIGAADETLPAPVLRREVALASDHGPVRRATLHATALGVFEAYLGGRPVSDDVLSPGWSAYEWRLRYRSYDVTDLLDGVTTTVLALVVGNGWYRGRLGWTGDRAIYGKDLAALAELEIEYADGHVELVATDDSWQSGPSGVLDNDLYDGQTIDARLPGRDVWLIPGMSLPTFSGVRPVAADLDRLTPYIGPPVRRQQVLRPTRIWTSPAGKTLVDFGQNLVGWIRCRVTGAADQEITVRHAEVLEHDELGTRPLRTAVATDRFILSGGNDDFEPTMTFHGFRYAQVDGWPGELSEDDLEAVVVHSDLTPIGTFECSNGALNSLHRNVVWSLRGNFLDVPTDCPQRDERLGWTGDLAVFAPTAAFLFDTKAFLAEWMENLAAEQAAADGRVPYVVPDVLKYSGVPDVFHPVDSAAIWSDAAVWVPWALWTAYGDRELLARHLPVMRAHVHRVEGLLSDDGVWENSFQFGDWLDPDAPPDDPAAAKADAAVVATAAFYRSVSMTARAAEALGATSDAATLNDLANRVRDGFNRRYVSHGIVRSDCQTVYALAICFGLLDAAAQQAAGRRLAELVEGAGLRIATGFAGTPYVLDALTVTGHPDLAYRMLLQPDAPGWLYPVSMGATTIWERWDSMLPDGSINPGAMTSFNHYAFGAVADWMHRVIGGLAPSRRGYDEVLVAPVPGPGVTWARTALDTRHGRVEVAWAMDAFGSLTVDLQVPADVTAIVRLPEGDCQVVGEGTHSFTASLTPAAAGTADGQETNA